MRGLVCLSMGVCFAKQPITTSISKSSNYVAAAPCRFYFNSNNLPEHEAWTSDAHAKPPNECTEKHVPQEIRMQGMREAEGKISPTDALP